MGQIQFSSEKPGIPIPSSDSQKTALSPEQAFGNITVSLDLMSVALNGDPLVDPPIPSTITTEEKFLKDENTKTFLNEWITALNEKTKQLPNEPDTQDLIRNLENFDMKNFSAFKQKINDCHGALQSTFAKKFEGKQIGLATDYGKNEWEMGLKKLEDLRKPSGPAGGTTPLSPPSESLPPVTVSLIPPMVEDAAYEDFVHGANLNISQGFTNLKKQGVKILQDFNNYQTAKDAKTKQKLLSETLQEASVYTSSTNDFLLSLQTFKNGLTNRTKRDLTDDLKNNNIILPKSNDQIGYDLSGIDTIDNAAAALQENMVYLAQYMQEADPRYATTISDNLQEFTTSTIKVFQDTTGPDLTKLNEIFYNACNAYKKKVTDQFTVLKNIDDYAYETQKDAVDNFRNNIFAFRDYLEKMQYRPMPDFSPIASNADALIGWLQTEGRRQEDGAPLYKNVWDSLQTLPTFPAKKATITAEATTEPSSSPSLPVELIPPMVEDAAFPYFLQGANDSLCSDFIRLQNAGSTFIRDLKDYPISSSDQRKSRLDELNTEADAYVSLTSDFNTKLETLKNAIKTRTKSDITADLNANGITLQKSPDPSGYDLSDLDAIAQFSLFTRDVIKDFKTRINDPIYPKIIDDNLQEFIGFTNSVFSTSKFSGPDQAALSNYYFYAKANNYKETIGKQLTDVLSSSANFKNIVKPFDLLVQEVNYQPKDGESVDFIQIYKDADRVANYETGALKDLNDAINRLPPIDNPYIKVNLMKTYFTPKAREYKQAIANNIMSALSNPANFKNLVNQDARLFKLFDYQPKEGEGIDFTQILNDVDRINRAKGGTPEFQDAFKDLVAEINQLPPLDISVTYFENKRRQYKQTIIDHINDVLDVASYFKKNYIIPYSDFIRMYGYEPQAGESVDFLQILKDATLVNSLRAPDQDPEKFKEAFKKFIDEINQLPPLDLKYIPPKET